MGTGFLTIGIRFSLVWANLLISFENTGSEN